MKKLHASRQMTTTTTTMICDSLGIKINRTRVFPLFSFHTTPQPVISTMRIVSLLSTLALAKAFVPSTNRPKRKPFVVSLSAEGGPPQYEKRGGILRQAELVGEGSVMLHIDVVVDGEAAPPLDYQPGHVLALEIENPATATSADEKTARDTEANGGWMRGPYTVSRGTENSFDVLIKVVGDKSKAFEMAKPGTPVRFGGKFHVPIVEGISTSSKRVVLLSTGVGIGPCVGAVEQFLADDNFSSQVDLFASFRNQPDVIYRDYLDGLMAQNSNQFQWKPVITSEMGRISASEDNVRKVLQDDICSVTETHYHLIGNGQMVNEWKAGLAQAGVPTEKVTTESYFNHKAESSEDAISVIASTISSAAVSVVIS
jgi:ferredoxin-NADP reductase